MTAPPSRPQPVYEDLELRVDPEPVRRAVWIVAAAAIVVIIALLIASRTPAPRPAQTTDPAPSRDLSAPAEASSSGLTGAPLVREALDSGDGSQTGNSEGPNLPDENPVATALTTGGAPLPLPAGDDAARPVVAGTLDPRVGREGDIAHTGSSGRYLAIPLGPGVRIRICGPAACLVATSTDAGPDHDMLEAGRIADLDVGRWELLCGMPARFGLCPGSWVVIGSHTPAVTLPPTDSEVTP
jgi:hypothetical protein